MCLYLSLNERAVKDVLSEKTKQALNSIKKHKNFTQLQRAKKKKMYIRKC